MRQAKLTKNNPGLVASTLIKPGYIHSRINKIPVNNDSIEAMTPETDKKVYGSFVNIECPGQPAKVCGLYYKGMPYFSKTFEDGEKCTIPLSVARWINERIHYDQHSYIMDENGKHVKNLKPQSRYKFLIESYSDARAA